jgi:hypothetical protein
MENLNNKEQKEEVLFDEDINKEPHLVGDKPETNTLTKHYVRGLVIFIVLMCLMGGLLYYTAQKTEPLDTAVDSSLHDEYIDLEIDKLSDSSDQLINTDYDDLYSYQGWPTYTSNKYGYIIKYSPYCVANDYQLRGDDISFRSPGKDSCGTSVMVREGDFNELNRTLGRKDGDVVEVLRVKEYMIDGGPALETIVTFYDTYRLNHYRGFEKDGVKYLVDVMRDVDVLVVKKDEDRYEKITESFEKTARSLRLNSDIPMISNQPGKIYSFWYHPENFRWQFDIDLLEHNKNYVPGEISYFLETGERLLDLYSDEETKYYLCEGVYPTKEVVWEEFSKVIRRGFDDPSKVHYGYFDIKEDLVISMYQQCLP